MTVLVFDSGIGGLSVLREARMLMHDQRFLYVGDDAGFPYGDWHAEALTEHITTLFDTLINRYHPTLAIVACNTASTLIMPALRSRFELPFVGIVPAIKPAAERSATRLISVLATPGTIQRAHTRSLIERFAAHCEVTLVGATRLARMAEAHMQGEPIDLAELEAEILPCFVEREGRRTDIITLGCTHYPFLVNPMRKVAPWPVDWLDPAEAVARHALSQLPRTGDTPEEGATTSPDSATNASVMDTDPGKRTHRLPDTAIMTSNRPSVATVRLLASCGLPLSEMPSTSEIVQAAAALPASDP